jgi:hypothetical protein
MVPLFRFNCCGRGRASRARIDHAVHRECPCDGHGGAGPSTGHGAADTDGYGAGFASRRFMPQGTAAPSGGNCRPPPRWCRRVRSSVYP